MQPENFIFLTFLPYLIVSFLIFFIISLKSIKLRTIGTNELLFALHVKGFYSYV